MKPREWMLLLLLGFTLASAKDWFVLKKVEWERDSGKVNFITLRFQFNDPPTYFPVFFDDNPLALRVNFSDTRVEAEASQLKNVPPPLSHVSLLEKKLSGGDPATQVTIGVDKRYPFFTRLDGKSICLTLDVSSAVRERKVILDKTSQSSANSVLNITVQETGENVEVLINLAKPVKNFTSYVLEEPSRLVMDFPGVLSDSTQVQEVGIAPVTTLKTIKADNFTSLVFGLKKKVEFKTLQKGTCISLLLPREKSLVERNKKWIYLSASALLLGGISGAVIMGGDETKAAPGASGNGNSGGDWNDPPPDPGTIH